ncbi:hypothetical protein GALMADRAFT_242128 [Galerina marginata CBS 339.88]|uniref:Uncharacterized protein n=1 Tax=Galerina marginata (strain CBS 339.88) TaxID=685588 RepID=A0A067TA33_GALM3|nr:hypothetical protein GALMADRAFT_242128 [Galerina marginata CBS 339.88]
MPTTKGDHNERTDNDLKRPKPRRLFSIDSLRSGSSSRRSSASETPKGPRPLNPFDLSNVQEGDGEFEGVVQQPRHVKQATEPIPEPRPMEESNATWASTRLPSNSDPFRDLPTSPRLEPVRPIAIKPQRSFTPDIQPATPSPTRARWENLRQHVLPGPSRPMTPPIRPGSAQSSVQNNLPSRSTTPKPSRLARLGFKQVVEQARDMADDTRKLGEEIMRGCAIARYSEGQRFGKEKDVQGSTTNLTGTATMASSITTGGKKMDMRRPQSVASLATQSTTSFGTAGPSLRFLYQILFYHASSPELNFALNLPHESQVLSTLLCPFLTPFKYPAAKLEEEKITAMETFELLSKSWSPFDEAASVERCLWCTKAAGSLPPSSARTRILGLLWRLLVPGDRNRILLTTPGFHSISSSLLLLLVLLYRSSTSSANINNPYPSSPALRNYFSFAPANFQQPPHPDINLLQELIPQFLSGSLGELDDEGVQEVYGVEFAAADTRHLSTVRRAVFLDALVNTIEDSSATGEWLLCNAIEHYWPPPPFDAWTTLQAAISSRKLSSFCRLSLALLQPFISQASATPSTPTHSPRSLSSTSYSSSSSINSLDYQTRNSRIPPCLVSILQSRVIPEAEALSNGTELQETIVLDTRMRVARVLLEIICVDVDSGNFMTSPKVDIFGAPSPRFADALPDGMKELVKWAMNTLCQWYRAGDASPWKVVLERNFQQVIAGDWLTSIAILSSLLKYLPADLKRPIFSSIIPILNDQLVQNPPPHPFAALSSFLTSLSRTLPPVFFRPLFACTASDKEVIVVNHLCTLQVHSKYVEDYWVRDVEMMCMALLGDAGSVSPGGMQGQWGVARLGQLVLLVELIGKIQKIRLEKEASASTSDARVAEVIRFVTQLEGRLWLMIEAKERTALLPPSQRLLFCVLFREFRLLTRSVKPAPWLSRTLQWFNIFFADEDLGDLEQDVTDSMERVQGLYMAAQEGVQQSNKRHTSTIFAMTAYKAIPVAEAVAGKPLDLAATFVEHRKLIDSLSKGYPSKALKLFVTMSTLIAEEDYRSLGPLLWEHCLLDNADSSSTASACFLLMQCAEKTPLDLLAVIEVDLQTSDDTTRLEGVRKIAILINWRFQIMTQNFLTDRTHRPFKLARPPLPFIATDIGTSLYVHIEDSKENKDNDDVPLELRQRLAELGWAEEDAGVVDPLQEWIRTPMSILPANQLDRMEVGTADLAPPHSPLSSPQPSPRKPNSPTLQPEDASALLRRNSSSGGPISGVKRRAVFVPSLTLVFPRLATLLFDPNFAVASAARTTILDLMRNDPALLTRPVLEHLVGDNKDIKLAISTLTALMHVHRLLPPPLTHNIFNNLAGFLKLISKDTDSVDALQDFSLVIPVLASIATQVSGMSIKEIRRSKIEHFVIPSGSLWFASSAPKGPMFPRSLEESRDPFETVPPTLVSITMIRVSQNMFFLAMLKRNYQDVQVVRKNMSRLILPSLDDLGLTKSLDLYDFMPRKHQPDTRPSLKNGTVEVLSLVLSRSYILLVAQIFRSMHRHLSDRHELAVLVDGLNRTLIAHGDDANIVSHVLIALMVASTRFRRLFTTGGGYTLFMPALVKVYTEKPSHPGIRGAVEYAISRFYALHKEAFLYQSINTIGQLAMLPDIEVDWFSKGVFDLFASLRKGSAPGTADVADIRNANKAEEREALIIHTADEKPQTFLAAIRRVESQTGRQMSLQLPDEYESSHLSMDDFVRLFLTVIAHDLSISRAQHFLGLLRFLVPHLYNASASTRTVLADGIVALGAIMVKAFSKPKGGDNLPKPSIRDEDVAFLDPEAGPANNSKERSRTPSDSKLMRLDYLKLVLSFGEAGGQVTLIVARHAMDVVKSLLKDWGDTNMEVLANFLASFIKMLLGREEPAAPKAVVAFLRELSPILHAYMLAVNFTGVFETILELAQMPQYANDLVFSQVVVGEICTAGLAACDLAASENQLMTLQYRPSLISLLAEAIFLKDVDIISEVEKRPPTYQFLAGVVLPLVLAMKTEGQIIADGLRTEEHRTKLSVAWLRLLFYAVNACQKSRRDDDDTHSRGLGGSFRSKSDKGRQESAFWRSHLPTFMTALQVIKVVVIRGAADISSLPRVGIWERIAAFCHSILTEGNATFALQVESSSTTTTPSGSPRTSGQFDMSNSGSNLFMSTSSGLSRPASPIFNTDRPRRLSRPRIIDYSLWSMLEFACAYRSPLRMQLKILIMEKVVALDQELQRQAGSSGGLSPFPTSPSSRRVSTSLFSKSRQRASGLSAPSPDSSPRIMPSSSSLMPSPSLLEIPSRRPGYQISPISPHDRPGLPKIVHLGPTSPAAFLPISSPMIGAGLPGIAGVRASRISTDGVDSSTTSRATKIKSLKLIQETYRRIRGVQAFMGYDLLLPMPGIRASHTSSSMSVGKDKHEDAALETWSKQQALAAVVNETKDLLEEFEESFGLDEDSVMVDIIEPRTPNS